MWHFQQLVEQELSAAEGNARTAQDASNRRMMRLRTILADTSHERVEATKGMFRDPAVEAPKDL